MAAMRLAVEMIWVMAVMGLAQTPADAPDPYAGTFRREQVVLQLAKENGAYSGTLTVQGRKLPVTAKAAEKTASGTFEMDGREYAFTLTPYADGLILTAEGLTYRLERSSKADLH